MFYKRVFKKATGVLKTSLIIFCSLFITACVAIPDGVKKRTVQTDQPTEIRLTCHPGNDDHVISSRNSKSRMLDPTGFRLLNWNVFKGESKSWLKAFAHFSDGQDLITLQEAYLTENFRTLLDKQELNWDLATAFKKLNYAAGVMIASRITPETVCVQRTMEPWLLLPKTTIISTFPLQNSEASLLLVNIHAVNFTLRNISYRNQLEQIAAVIRQHRGPVILAGDFNTWSSTRERILKDILAEPLSLSKVYFNSQTLATTFDHQIDHVYYRDLDVLINTASSTRESDHNPMWVTFKHAKKNTQ